MMTVMNSHIQSNYMSSLINGVIDIMNSGLFDISNFLV